jgi:PQQ-like domain
MRLAQRSWGAIGIAIVVVTTIWWTHMQGRGHVPNSKATEMPSGVTWSQEFNAVSGLAAAASGVVASVVIATKPYLVGIDAAGRLRWQKAVEVPDPALLVAGGRSVYAVIEHRIMTIDPADGSVGATREVDPPLGGWTPATTLSIGDDLLISDALGIERLRAFGLETLWKVTPALDETNDGMQQLVYGPPWIAAVSNHAIMVISERGESIWKRQLPTDTRLAGDHPLILADRRVWVGLAKVSDPSVRYLYEISALDGTPASETSIDDLAMFCPAHVSSGVLVLDTQRGLAGFDTLNGMKRLWSIEAPVAMGRCIPHDGHLLVATRNGKLLRVAFADGRKETLVRLPQRQVWVPPAPDLRPGVHSESTGTIEHLVSLPGGAVFSVSWSNDQAAVQNHPL